MSATEKYYNPLSIGDASVPIGTLVADITNASTAMSCAGINALVPVFRISIDNEAMLVTSNIAGVQFMTRGIEGTTAVAHAAGASVYPIVTASSLTNNPLALTTSGDLPYLDASLNQARLPIGSATGILSSETGIPSWVTATGTGVPVRATSPTLVTPTLGVALATSVNGLVITSTTGTLTIASGKTLTVNNSITLAGTDARTYTFPSTSCSVSSLDLNQAVTGNNTFSGTATFNASTTRCNGWLILRTGSPFTVNLDSALKYVASAYAGAMTLESSDGRIAFYTAPTGTAGNSATITERITFPNTGGLKINYDGSNFVTFSASSVGSLTVAPTGTNPSITLTPAGTGVVNLTRTVLAAGEAAAGAAPLKLTSGTNLTTAEAGALEYNGTNLFFTRAGTTRETVMVGLTGAAPSTSIGVGIVNYYGTAATNFLGDPVAWMLQNYGGTVYKIPLYT